jgi:hypothetical protein
VNSNRTLAAPRRNAGDFDCSGEDIERDWVQRTGCWSRVERVLLTRDQVLEYELPATEGKRGDPRWPGFARRYDLDPARRRPGDPSGGGFFTGAVHRRTAPLHSGAVKNQEVTARDSRDFGHGGQQPVGQCAAVLLGERLGARSVGAHLVVDLVAALDGEREVLGRLAFPLDLHIVSARTVRLP